MELLSICLFSFLISGLNSRENRLVGLSTSLQLKRKSQNEGGTELKTSKISKHKKSTVRLSAVKATNQHLNDPWSYDHIYFSDVGKNDQVSDLSGKESDDSSNGDSDGELRRLSSDVKEIYL